MRSLKYIGFLFLVLLVPFQVKALGGSVTVSCGKTTLKALESTTCQISGHSSDEVSSLHLEIGLDSSLELGTITSSSIWEGNGSGGVFDLYTDSNKKNDFAIGSFVVKAKNLNNVNAEISIKNVTFSDNNFETYSVSGVSKTIRIPSTNNKLSSLSVSGASLDFSADKTTYDVSVNTSSVEITARKADAKASVSGTGTKSLNYGKNTFKITVKSEAGASKVYTLNITRNDTRSNDNKLEWFDISDCNFTFIPSKSSYSINVENEVSKVTLTGALSSSKAKFVASYGLRDINLNEGNNTILVKIEAENGSVATYTFNIYRKAKKQDDKKPEEDNNTKSSDNRLKILTLSKGILNFDPEVLEYIVNLPNDTTEITIEGDTNDRKATLTGLGKKTLKVGDNVFKVVVTAENNSTRTYEIKVVVDEAPAEGLDADNTLKELTVSGYELNFSKDQLLYELAYNDEDSLKIDALANSDLATVTIIGNENLKANSEILIVVTAENGENKTYKIVLTESKSDSNLLVPILIGCGVLAIGGVVAFVIVKKKKNKKDLTIGED